MQRNPPDPPGRPDRGRCALTDPIPRRGCRISDISVMALGPLALGGCELPNGRGTGSQAPTPPTVRYSVVFYSSRLTLSSLLPVRLVRQQLLLRLLL